MKKLINNKKNKKLFFIFVTIYVCCIFINQQKSLNSYKNSQKYYEEQITAKLDYQASLYETKSNINSTEYIEQVAREKLDMYLPNERVYVDKNR